MDPEAAPCSEGVGWCLLDFAVVSFRLIILSFTFPDCVVAVRFLLALTVIFCIGSIGCTLCFLAVTHFRSTRGFVHLVGMDLVLTCSTVTTTGNELLLYTCR